jgi:glyoxylase-like metal-dependent hydrolase (beta-lactamase superfamily II)
LFGCPETRRAILLDPVLETVGRDLEVLRKLQLTLAYTLETHLHADHLTSASRLRSLTGSKVAYPDMDHLPCADVGVAEDKPLAAGSVTLRPLFTPGHTNHHHSYLLDVGGFGAVFTGDALLIDGCGRTDFQNGNASTLHRSVNEKLFSLPEETIVYPAHDYQDRRISSIGQERSRNPRLGGGKTLEQFVEIMSNLNLDYPKKLDAAVPANRLCGECPEEIRKTFETLCEPSIQG